MMDNYFDICIPEPGPYGLRIKGGKDYRSPIFVTQVTSNSLADKAGIKKTMQIISVNGECFENITHSEAVSIIKNAKSLNLKLFHSVLERINSNISNTNQTEIIRSNSLNSSSTMNTDESKTENNNIVRRYKNAKYRNFFKQMDLKSKNGYYKDKDYENSNCLVDKISSSQRNVKSLQDSDQTDSTVILSEKEDLKHQSVKKSEMSKNVSKSEKYLDLSTKEIVDKYLSPYGKSLRERIEALYCISSLHASKMTVNDIISENKFDEEKNNDIQKFVDENHRCNHIKCNCFKDKTDSDTKYSEINLFVNNSPNDKNLDFTIQNDEFSDIERDKKKLTLNKIKGQFKKLLNKKSTINKDSFQKNNHKEILDEKKPEYFNECEYVSFDEKSDGSRNENINESFEKLNVDLMNPVQVTDLRKENLLNKNDNIFRPSIIRIVGEHNSVSSHELSFEKNECIHLLRRIDEENYEVELKGTIGIIHASNLSIQSTGRILEYFNFYIAIGVTNSSNRSSSRVHLSYSSGDYFILNSIIDDKYFEATINNNRGIVLRKNVQVFRPIYRLLFSSENDKLEKMSIMNKYIGNNDSNKEGIFVCQSFQNYKPVVSDEIEMEIDDILYVKKFYSDGWGYGFNETISKCGMFPVFFCDLIIPIE